MKLNRLKPIDLRKIWQGEASHFTPWLAEEENISLLSDAIGIELEVICEEKSVGPFRADILCKNTIDSSYVLIENQLEKTDHTHLGQILTYAAGLDAVTIVWIAARFTEEHRASIDWLNRITEENIRFFGIEIEVYKIGNSLPAPMFQLVAKPNDWSKKSKVRPGGLTEAQEFYLEYWGKMKEFFDNSDTRLKHQKPYPQQWTSFATGRSYFGLSAVASYRDNLQRVDFFFNTKDAKDVFDLMKDKYEEISRLEIDPNVVWNRMDGKVNSGVSLVKENIDVTNRADWENQFTWFIDNLEKFDAFFRPKIKLL